MQHERAPRSLSKSNSSNSFTVSMRALSSRAKRRSVKLKREKEMQSSEESSLPSSPMSPAEQDEFLNSGHSLGNLNNSQSKLKSDDVTNGRDGGDYVSGESEKKDHEVDKFIDYSNAVNYSNNVQNVEISGNGHAELFTYNKNTTTNNKPDKNKINNDNDYSSSNISIDKNNSNSDNYMANNVAPMNQQSIPSNVWAHSTLPSMSPLALHESAIQLLYMSVSWARNIPMFMDLPFRDQAILLEEGWSELFLLNAVQFPFPVDITTLFAAAGLNAGQSNSTEVMAEVRVLQNVLARFHQLEINSVEYACLKAVVLFKSGACENLL